MSKSIVVELAEQGKNSYRNSAGDYLVRLPEPIVVEKGDTVAVKSVFVDNVSASQNGTIHIDPDDNENPNTGVNCSITFGYYYQDWGSSLQTETQSKSFSSFIANQFNSPNAPTAGSHPTAPTREKASGIHYTMNRPTGDQSAVSKKLVSFDIIWDGTTVGHPNTDGGGPWLVAQLALDIKDITGNFGSRTFGLGVFPDRARKLGLFKSSDPNSVDYNTLTINSANLSKGFSLPSPEFGPYGESYQSAFFHLFGSGGGTEDILPIPISIPDSISGDWYKGIKYLDNNRNHTKNPNNQWGNTGFSVSPDNQVFQVYGATDLVNVAYTQTINFNIPAGDFQPPDLCKLITDTITDINLKSANTTTSLNNDYTFSTNPLLKTVRQLFNEDDANKTDQPFISSPAFFSQDDNHTFTFNTAKARPDLPAQTNANKPVEVSTAGFINPLIGSSQFALSFNAEQQKVELQAIHSPLYGKDGVPQVRFSKGEATAQANLKDIQYLNKNTGIFITSMTPAKVWFNGLKLPKTVESQLFHAYSWKEVDANTVVKVYYDRIYGYNDGVNITGEEIAMDGIIEKKRTLASEATYTEANNDAGTASATVDGVQAFDIPPIFSTQTNVDGVDIVEINSAQTRGIMGTQTLTANTIDVLDVEKAGGYFKIEVAMPNIMPEVRESHNKNNKISSIISRYNSLGQYTSSYGEGSIPYTYNSDFPTYLSEFKIRVLEPNGELSSKLGSCSAVFLEVVKPLPK